MDYAARLRACKRSYPFAVWRKRESSVFPQYTKENCLKAQVIFDLLIDDLIAIGEDADEAEKVACFEDGILALNDLQHSCIPLPLIVTEEREELCALVNEISMVAGLNPLDYGKGEGLASEWRDW